MHAAGADQVHCDGIEKCVVAAALGQAALGSRYDGQLGGMLLIVDSVAVVGVGVNPASAHTATAAFVDQPDEQHVPAGPETTTRPLPMSRTGWNQTRPVLLVMLTAYASLLE